ncbi:hypothetical protein B0H16DRAFT_1458108 [Mycena metata]|uniref:Uncharacterized protein n=1 Tax=Mycena metata TaxID=1033252 RepID=A0AAD7J410_9AGAR|nr:hypothetical protein B0H16DRAFT_1458108 [Mycena metata]
MLTHYPTPAGDIPLCQSVVLKDASCFVQEVFNRQVKNLAEQLHDRTTRIHRDSGKSAVMWRAAARRPAMGKGPTRRAGGADEDCGGHWMGVEASGQGRGGAQAAVGAGMRGGAAEPNNEGQRGFEDPWSREAGAMYRGRMTLESFIQGLQRGQEGWRTAEIQMGTAVGLPGAPEAGANPRGEGEEEGSLITICVNKINQWLF